VRFHYPEKPTDRMSPSERILRRLSLNLKRGGTSTFRPIRMVKRKIVESYFDDCESDDEESDDPTDSTSEIFI